MRAQCSVDCSGGGLCGCLFFASGHARGPFELSGPIELIAVRRMHFVFFCADEALHHPHHDRIEVTDPRQFEACVSAVHLLAHILFERVHHARLDALALELGYDPKDDGEDPFGFFRDLEPPQETQLLPQTELSLERSDDSVQVGNHQVETDGFVVVVGEVHQPFVDDRAQGIHQCESVFAVDRFDSGEIGPRLVVDREEFFGIGFDMAFVHVLETVSGLFLKPFHPFVDVLGEQSFGQLAQVGVLVEIVLEAVVLEQLDVVLEVVGIGVERREFESLDQKAPPLVATPKLMGPSIASMPRASEPVTCCVEQQVGDLLIIDRFEESAPLRWAYTPKPSPSRGYRRRRYGLRLGFVRRGRSQRIASSVAEQFVGFDVEPVFRCPDRVDRSSGVRFCTGVWADPEIHGPSSVSHTSSRVYLAILVR